MDQPVALFRPTASWRVRVAAARAQRALGMAGIAGLVALLVGLAVGWAVWTRHQQFLDEGGAQALEAAPRAAASPAPVREAAPVRWPDAGDVPTLLARMERAAVREGLGWPQADYRVLPATAELPASLEVRCTLKGPYVAIRRFVTILLLDQPTLTMREFAISRASTEASNVDARLTVVVYLGASAAEPRP